MASCYNTLARTANEASPYRQPSAALELPRLPDWECPVPPETALTLKQGTVERQQGLLRHWRSCHLLLTKDRMASKSQMFLFYVFLYMFNVIVIILYINIYIFHNVCIVFASIFWGIEAEEGSVHCYDGLPEASGPVWSGSSSSAD